MKTKFGNQWVLRYPPSPTFLFLRIIFSLPTLSEKCPHRSVNCRTYPCQPAVCAGVWVWGVNGPQTLYSGGSGACIQGQCALIGRRKADRESSQCLCCAPSASLHRPNTHCFQPVSFKSNNTWAVIMGTLSSHKAASYAMYRYRMKDNTVPWHCGFVSYFLLFLGVPLGAAELLQMWCVVWFFFFCS